MGLFSKSEQVTVKIPTMNCGHCEAKVTTALSAIPGVQKVDASSQTKFATIHASKGQKPDHAAIAAALEGTGYTAEPV
ncbi:MAG: copper chaperone [Spirochaetaceae bacterium]|nr:MAG: copper chaperone [Spirochaetaceae bacterium]